jgi:endoglucanase
VGKVLPAWVIPAFTEVVRDSVQAHRDRIEELQKINPYGVPYEPNIWGAGWGIQRFGVEQYFFHTGYPDIFPASYMHNALHFVLGRHPGVNTASFASGVGIALAAGGLRHQPRRVVVHTRRRGFGNGPDTSGFSGNARVALLWQQTEYVMGGGRHELHVPGAGCGSPAEPLKSSLSTFSR